MSQKFETKTQWLERTIREYLTVARETSEVNYAMPMYQLFTHVTANASTSRQSITASDFCKAIGDLKKVGIVASRGNSQVLLSDAAWQTHRQFHQKMAQPKAAPAPPAAPKYSARNPFGDPDVKTPFDEVRS